uniref:Uncharacterized protein n=1 Tax=Pristionchus pacificus TaxID=54126 RepID=A0A2A6CCZ1_PRIPA|eukprot:PDM75960.1 hypothetical protein PRIPAC_37633 [Pristionchus pacificus]
MAAIAYPLQIFLYKEKRMDQGIFSQVKEKEEEGRNEGNESLSLLYQLEYASGKRNIHINREKEGQNKKEKWNEKKDEEEMKREEYHEDMKKMEVKTEDID